MQELPLPRSQWENFLTWCLWCNGSALTPVEGPDRVRIPIGTQVQNNVPLGDRGRFYSDILMCMITTNRFLQYAYYTSGIIWLVWGAYYFFTILEAYHRNFITSVYGLIFAVVIFYLGYLHRKALQVHSLFFPMLSILSLLLALYIVYGYFTAPEHGGLGLFILICWLALTVFVTLISGTWTVRKVWRKSIAATGLLIALVIVWTYLFT